MNNLEQELEQAIKDRNVGPLAYWMFGVELTEGQEDIVKTILYPEYNRVCISAMTRWGKTFSTAVAVQLYVYLNKDKKIFLIAPTNDQAKILRNEIANLLVESPQMQLLVDDATKGTDRLKKEVSKKRITFKNGCSIETLSAEGKAERIMGRGGHLNVIDESCLIDSEVFSKRIFRMLGDGPDSKLVELSNPWYKQGHFYEHWQSDRYHNIQIDYKQAIKEGRTTEDFIEEAREQLTNTEFQVLYKSEFPDDTEETLIKWQDIQQALDNQLCLGSGETFYGVDPARQGKDTTVITKVIHNKDNGLWEVKEIDSWNGADLMETSGRVANIVGNKDDEIRVDEIGMGGGVVDRLEELDYNVRGVKANKTPKEDKHRFRDRKAEQYFTLKSLFEENKIDIPDHKILREELNALEYSFNSRGKIKIDDPAKSPDFADSLMLATMDKEFVPYTGILT